jgi:hypothetical protein
MTTPRNAKALREQGFGGIAENTTPAFCYPDPHTVKGRVLGALLRREQQTHFDCWRRFGSARLSHHVYCLRRGLGWPVEMDERQVTTSDAGRPATIGVYYLDPDVIAEAGERGQEYAAECARIEAERRAA